MKTQHSPSSARLCSQCGSPLIQIKEKTRLLAGQKFPVTITTFKCSDKECQKRIDKDRKERLAKQKERLLKKPGKSV